MILLNVASKYISIDLSHTQEEYSFNGEYVQFENVNLNPKPIQNPPRIWIGGTGEKPKNLNRDFSCDIRCGYEFHIDGL